MVKGGDVDVDVEDEDGAVEDVEAEGLDAGEDITALRTVIIADIITDRTVITADIADIIVERMDIVDVTMDSTEAIIIMVLTMVTPLPQPPRRLWRF